MSFAFSGQPHDLISCTVASEVIESFRFDYGYDYDYEIIYSNLLLNHVIFLRHHVLTALVVTKMTTKFVTNHVVK